MSLGEKFQIPLNYASLRAKILIGFLFSLVPVLSIIVLSYYSSRDAAYDTSHRVMKLISAAGAEDLNSYFRKQEDLFLQWTKDDIFGLAIEFNTNEAIGKHLQELLDDSNDFLFVMLLNRDGDVLNIAAKRGIRPELLSQLREGPTKELANIYAGPKHKVQGVKRKFLNKSEAGSSYTLLYSFKTFSSSGENNGVLLAYLNWAPVHQVVQELEEKVRQHGFASGDVAILDIEKNIAVSHSDRSRIDLILPMSMHLVEWLQGDEFEDVYISNEKSDKMKLFASRLVASDLSSDDPVSYALLLQGPEKDVMARVRRLLRFSLLIALVGVGIGVFLIWAIALWITKPITNLVDVLEKYGGGDKSVKADCKGGDEISFLGQRFNTLFEQINKSALSLESSERKYRMLFNYLQEAIDSENYTFRILKESDDDELAVSMNKVLDTLMQSSDREKQAKWLKAGQAELTDSIAGEQDLRKLCSISIRFVCNYLNAQLGTFYVVDNLDKRCLELISSYAYRRPDNISSRFKFGEGLIGQVAQEQEKMLLEEVPEDYLKIKSGIGETLPRNILIYPLVYEGEVKGVVELCSVDRFSSVHLELMDLVSRNISIALISSVYHSELQAQADELMDRNNR